MNKSTLQIAVLLAAISLGIQAPSRGSDWTEDSPRAPQLAQNEWQQSDQMPPVAPQADAHLSPGGYLTGNASMLTQQAQMMRPQLPPLPFSGYAPQSGERQAFMLQTRDDNVVPPTSLQGWLQRTHPEFNLSAQNNPDQVLEVLGAWDNSSMVLKAMGIRYHEMKPKELRGYPLNNVKVIVINCEGKIPGDLAEPIRQWVIQGGYLISTDWTLSNFLQRAFPGMVQFNGKKVRGETVDANVTASEPRLVAGTQAMRARWKLDDDSEEVRILRPDDVHVLARSFKLAENDPNQRLTRDSSQWGVLAVAFNYGRGRVLHLVGHFDYNSGAGLMRYILPDSIPGVGIGLRQAIATNFLLEALEKNQLPQGY
jgi:hypothetical protein